MRRKIFVLAGALRATAQEALAMDRSRATAFFAGLALAMAGDTRQAAAVVDELSKRFPGDTVVNNSWGPTIRSEIEVNRGNASKAIELLQLASPYETGLVVRLAGYARPHRPAPCPISNWGERAFCPATRLRPARLTRTSSPFGKTPIRLFLS